MHIYMNCSTMTKKEKIKEIFLSVPRTLALQKIRSFLASEWFVEIQVWWSHFKIQGDDGRAYIIPLRRGDCAGVYKEGLKKFYLSYQQKDENN